MAGQSLATFPAALARAVLTSAGVLGVLVASELAGIPHPPDPRLPDAPGQVEHIFSVWEESYSERYPGCVAAVLWPRDEQPVAIVTRTPGGHVDRVPVGAGPLPSTAVTIGACRSSG